MPFPSAGELHNTGIKPALAGGFFTIEPLPLGWKGLNSKAEAEMVRHLGEY